MDTPYQPLTYGELFSDQMFSTLLSWHLEQRIRLINATDYAKSICLGKRPQMPDGVAPEDTLTDDEAEKLTGWPANHDRAVMRWRNRNAPWGNYGLPRRRL